MPADDPKVPPATDRAQRLWCGPCARAVEVTEAAPGSRCPACGCVLTEAPAAPWHFKLLVVAVVLYLAWRAFQGIAWLMARV